MLANGTKSSRHDWYDFSRDGAVKTADTLGERIDFTQALHSSTKRDYVARVVEFDKATCAEVASRFGQDYWDGERQYGYGGYRYDRRWRPIAGRMAQHYGLPAGTARVGL